jgi:hypothetical protein
VFLFPLIDIMLQFLVLVFSIDIWCSLSLLDCMTNLICSVELSTILWIKSCFTYCHVVNFLDLQQSKCIIYYFYELNHVINCLFFEQKKGWKYCRICNILIGPSWFRRFSRETWSVEC